jgi:hypothetical protein
MGVLKVVAAALLGFLLSLSLVIFGLVFTVKMTALNAGFITSRLDALDVSAVAEEIIDEQVPKGELPKEFTEELRIALLDTVDRLEPIVKEQVNASINSTLDYLLGKKTSLDLALTLKNTFLNSEFIASFLEEIDISSLAEAYLSAEAVQAELPAEFNEELRAALVDAIDRLEPVIKERVGAVAEPVIDYSLGMSQNLDPVSILRESLLNSDFVAFLLDQLDIPSLLADVDMSSLALDFLSQQSSEELPEEVKYLTEYVDEIIIELEPWLKEQASAVADPVFSYLLGESQSLNVSISMEPVREALDNTLKVAFLESPPAGLASLSQTELEQYFDEHYGELTEGLPLAYELDASALEATKIEITKALADVETRLEKGRQDVAKSLSEAEKALGEAREYIGYFRLGYSLLIVFMLLLMAGIILIYREVKGAARTLGSIFLTNGVLDLIAVLVTKALIKTPLAQLEVSASLREWTIQSVSSSLAPLLVLAIVLLVLGAALLAISIIYPRRQRLVATGTPQV